jgi:hypothetical protein
LFDCLIFLFNLMSQNFMTHAPAAVATEKAALLDMAIAYLGSSLLGHRYC